MTEKNKVGSSLVVCRQNWPYCLKIEESRKVLSNISFAKPIAFNVEGFTTLYSREELKKILEAVQNTLEMYDSENFTDEDIDFLNEKAEEKTSKNLEKEIEESRERDEKYAHRKQTNLYLMQNSETKDLKIGVSDDPHTRKVTLQSESGREINLLYIIPLRGYLESDLHDKFSHLRLKGEWFKYDQSIIQEFERLATESVE